MRKIIVRHPNQIAPFNEPARALSVLNTPLWQWQQNLLAPYTEEQIIVDDPHNAPRDSIETLMHGENLWFDEAFLTYFVKQARLKGKPVRAAIQGEEPPFMQNGLKALTRSFTQRGDYFLLHLWYFPTGVTDQAEALVVPSEAIKAPFRHARMAAPNQVQRGETEWVIPARAACPVDSWVHLLLINIILGLRGRVETFNRSAAGSIFHFRASLRGLIEGRPSRRSSAYVHVGRNCVIDPSAVVVGPVWIGDNVTIGPGCVVTESILGSNVTLSHSNSIHGCVIGNDCFLPWGASAYLSLYMEGASSGQGAAIEMSIIGRNSIVGSGTIMTDFNLLPVPLKAMGDHHLAQIGLPMLGGCVGHNCRIGSGLVIYPGRTIESDVVLVSSPTRRVIAKSISYEESDHHFIGNGDLHPRLYARAEDTAVDEEGRG